MWPEAEVLNIQASMHGAVVCAGRLGLQAVSKGDVCPRDEQKVVELIMSPSILDPSYSWML
jgi:hypothetical protein